jgi:Uma2 family endonuclease
MTAAEYLALGETSERYELIDGVVVMSPSSLPRHGRMAAELIRQIGNFVHAFTSPNGPQLFTETDLLVSSSIVYRPDIAAYGPGRLGPDVPRLDTPPDLIVEILSPSTKPLDLITKRGDYERFGVGEYWVGDPETAALRCWRRRGREFVEEPVPGEYLACGSIPGLSIDLSALRRICAAR